MTTPGFTVWLTGPDPTALRAVADDIVARLAARHRAAEIFDAETPGIEVLAGERLEGRVAFLAEVLAHHVVATVVALGPPAGEARQACAQLIEVLVHAGEPRTSRYAPPERPEVEIVLPEPVPGEGAERTIRTLEVMKMLGRETGGVYSEDEEREIIRRLKAFGYL